VFAGYDGGSKYKVTKDDLSKVTGREF
jgi:hypothetical protein